MKNPKERNFDAKTKAIRLNRSFILMRTMVLTSLAKSATAFQLSRVHLVSSSTVPPISLKTSLKVIHNTVKNSRLHQPLFCQSHRYSSTLNSSKKNTENQSKNLIESMLQRIRECNQKPNDRTFLDFVVDREGVGKVTPEMAEQLISAVNPPIFELVKTPNQEDVITLSDHAGKTHDSRTDAVMSVMKELREKNIIKGWRDEFYPVATSFYSAQNDQPLFLIERAATPTLGIAQYGVHVNGLVSPDKSSADTQEPKMWIARRSPNKSKYPGMLDHIVAGGQPAGISLIENVIKECGEEAGVPPELAKLALPTGVVSYETFNSMSFENDGVLTELGGLERSVLFNFDLYLPPDFVPKVVDGEVEDFFLWDMQQVRDSMDMNYHDPIKPNCYLVIIDYLMRKGYIGEEGPDTEGYLDVLKELKSGQCS